MRKSDNLPHNIPLGTSSEIICENAGNYRFIGRGAIIIYLSRQNVKILLYVNGIDLDYDENQNPMVDFLKADSVESADSFEEGESIAYQWVIN